MSRDSAEANLLEHEHVPGGVPVTGTGSHRKASQILGASDHNDDGEIDVIGGTAPAVTAAALEAATKQQDRARALAVQEAMHRSHDAAQGKSTSLVTQKWALGATFKKPATADAADLRSRAFGTYIALVVSLVALAAAAYTAAYGFKGGKDPISGHDISSDMKIGALVAVGVNAVLAIMFGVVAYKKHPLLQRYDDVPTVVDTAPKAHP